ncbi:3-deoxy-8-phosphooctulonate synthase [Bacteriovorax sp. Seq25_V]|uniref:3-deoxy-8-phosphooctulonate synthase n=1 Tax=Bacteriovorax sp. Seq25_V TaxID=1201288 RepID=UPI000389E5CD|nr:3-deoxy-8-phosphooctulonate synthase [Bacteriovorax sp. Seq25_V]EQC46604.1 3-deoxy-8-phosphooctulonate synthase [Bacteriovorax sp. Seq25_V]
MENKKFDFFVGTCVIESEQMCMDVAGRLTEIFAKYKDEVNFSYKGSFDKANRSSKDSFRGPGLEKGLEILAKVKKAYGVPLITDFHTAEQAMKVAEVVDTLQVPAFLCRQTDMIIAGAEACKKFGGQLKIKKGQFLSPEETGNIVEKANEYLPKERILLTERGTSFGYNNLVVDMASFQIMKSFGVRAIHDATHCVQRPGGLGKITGGKREQILTLARAAVAAGADGIFMEVHPKPEEAKSDSATSLPLDKAPEIIEKLLELHRVVRNG